MTAKEYLSRAYNLRRSIATQEIRLEELRTQAEHITADINGMPRGSGQSSPVERIAVQIADLSMELELDWLDLIQYQEDISKTINAVSDPILNQILSLRYLSYKPWSEIADTLHYTIGHTFKLHRKALGKVDVILNDSSLS
jgi:hypothetical protein